MECKMARKKKSKPAKTPKPPYEFLPLVPDRFYRRAEVVANRYLGYSNTQLEEKIKSGEIDPPISLSANSRACGWFGRDIIKLQSQYAAKRSRAA
jgi:hypothetical protein